MPIKDRAQKLKYDQRFSATLHVQRKSQGLCVDCGKQSDGGKVRCQHCRTYENKRLKTSRLVLKRKAIEYLGGKCVDCGLKTGFVSVYDFHHKDADDKDANAVFLKYDNKRVGGSDDDL